MFLNVLGSSGQRRFHSWATRAWVQPWASRIATRNDRHGSPSGGVEIDIARRDARCVREYEESPDWPFAVELAALPEVWGGLLERASAGGTAGAAAAASRAGARRTGRGPSAPAPAGRRS